MFQVLDGCSKKIGVVAKMTDPLVAALTKQAANLARVVAVVHRKTVHLSVPHPRLGLLTDRAHAFLRLLKNRELFERDAVVMPKVAIQLLLRLLLAKTFLGRTRRLFPFSVTNRVRLAPRFCFKRCFRVRFSIPTNSSPMLFTVPGFGQPTSLCLALPLLLLFRIEGHDYYHSRKPRYKPSRFGFPLIMLPNNGVTNVMVPVKGFPLTVPLTCATGSTTDTLSPRRAIGCVPA